MQCRTKTQWLSRPHLTSPMPYLVFTLSSLTHFSYYLLSRVYEFKCLTSLTHFILLRFTNTCLRRYWPTNITVYEFKWLTCSKRWFGGERLTWLLGNHAPIKNLDAWGVKCLALLPIFLSPGVFNAWKLRWPNLACQSHASSQAIKHIGFQVSNKVLYNRFPWSLHFK